MQRLIGGGGTEGRAVTDLSQLARSRFAIGSCTVSRQSTYVFRILTDWKSIWQLEQECAETLDFIWNMSLAIIYVQGITVSGPWSKQANVCVFSPPLFHICRLSQPKLRFSLIIMGTLVDEVTYCCNMIRESRGHFARLPLSSGYWMFNSGTGRRTERFRLRVPLFFWRWRTHYAGCFHCWELSFGAWFSSFNCDQSCLSGIHCHFILHDAQHAARYFGGGGSQHCRRHPESLVTSTILLCVWFTCSTDRWKKQGEEHGCARGNASRKSLQAMTSACGLGHGCCAQSFGRGKWHFSSNLYVRVLTR